MSTVEEENEVQSGTLGWVTPADAWVLDLLLPEQDESDEETPESSKAAEARVDLLLREQAEQWAAAEKSLSQKVFRKGLVENHLDLEIELHDPNLPLHSVETFEALNLRPELLKGVLAMEYKEPSKIQKTALPALLMNPPQNMIAQSQSGTGKTAAFVLAMLNRADTSKNYPHVVCLSPTFELAIQTGEMAKEMAKLFSPEIKIKYGVGGEMLTHALTEHILIGTPGKLFYWGNRSRYFDLSKVEMLVVEEADLMITVDEKLMELCEKIHNLLPKTCQMMLNSRPTPDKDVMKFAKTIIRNPIVLKLHNEQQSLENIKQYYVLCKTADEKRQFASRICYKNMGQTMIFCHTSDTASKLAKYMTDNVGLDVGLLLSGELEIQQFISVIDRSRVGKDRILITTNVRGRGIDDIEQVTMVINFDLPLSQNGKADCDTYFHRIGRLGRYGKSGVAINLLDVHRSRSLLGVLAQIETQFRRPILKLGPADEEEIRNLNG